jgi:hypothetical protein
LKKITGRGAIMKNAIPKYFVVLLINTQVIREKPKVSHSTPPSPIDRYSKNKHNAS